MVMNDVQPDIPSTLNISNSTYTFDNSRHQNFRFRWPIIKYVLKNPTGKAWKKLIKTCKYFFAKYPVYPVKKIKNHDKWEGDGEIINFSKIIRKLWIFERFNCGFLYSQPLAAVSKFILKVAKCDLRSLNISCQDLSWENYQMLTSSGSCRDLHFCNCSIKYSDGSDVKFDKLLENLQKIKTFRFVCKPGLKIFEKETVKRTAKILFGFKNIHYFILSNLDESFDISSFMDFLLNNMCFVAIYYADNLQFFDANKQMLENCFRQIVASRLGEVPDIWVPGFYGLQYQEYRKFADKNN